VFDSKHTAIFLNVG